MNIEFVDSYDSLSLRAKEFIRQSVQHKKDLLLCAATGNSPTETYRLLSGEYQKDPGLFSEIRVIKLDEWGGIQPDQEGSCESYIKKHLLQPLQIPEERYIGFHSNPKDPQEECKRISARLEEEGPIDLCILGLGSNGHLALNEPAEFLQAQCHVAQLSPSSLQHQMTSEMDKKPGYGLTLGMADILHSGKILMLITGAGKTEMVQKFLSGKISSKLPASFLWLHPDVLCLIDNKSIKLNL